MQKKSLSGRCQKHFQPIVALILILYLLLHKNEPAHDKKQQNDMHAQQKLRSAWASAQSDPSPHSLHEESLGP